MSATYAYKYGSKLVSITSTLFGEQNVAFEYGGDQKRRSMTTGGVTTQYNWDMDWNVINEENGAGALARTYTHNPQSLGRMTLAHVDGTNPATGAYRTYLHDHLGSTRSVINQTNDLLATYQYTPYGDLLSSNNPNTTTHLFTGHDWNPASSLYFAPFRYYNPQTARWLTRDPLGMVDGPNRQCYGGANPINKRDMLGLKEESGTRARCWELFADSNSIARERLAIDLGKLGLTIFSGIAGVVGCGVSCGIAAGWTGVGFPTCMTICSAAWGGISGISSLYSGFKAGRDYGRRTKESVRHLTRCLKKACD